MPVEAIESVVDEKQLKDLVRLAAAYPDLAAFRRMMTRGAVGGQGRVRPRAENGWQGGLRVSGIKVCAPPELPGNKPGQTEPDHRQEAYQRGSRYLKRAQLLAIQYVGPTYSTSAARLPGRNPRCFVESPTIGGAMALAPVVYRNVG
jgi:hypothetical protein